jgi:hypothetical protein
MSTPDASWADQDMLVRFEGLRRRLPESLSVSESQQVDRFFGELLPELLGANEAWVAVDMAESLGDMTHAAAPFWIALRGIAERLDYNELAARIAGRTAPSIGDPAS